MKRKLPIGFIPLLGVVYAIFPPVLLGFYGGIKRQIKWFRPAPALCSVRGRILRHVALSIRFGNRNSEWVRPCHRVFDVEGSMAS